MLKGERGNRRPFEVWWKGGFPGGERRGVLRWNTDSDCPVPTPASCWQRKVGEGKEYTSSSGVLPFQSKGCPRCVATEQSESVCIGGLYWTAL